MSPMQQIFLGLGAVATKTYVDDVFSTYLYTGDASTQTINNGIDLSGEGGLVWAKKRNKASSHTLIDTVRGNTKRLESNNADQEATGNNILNSFNNNGFTVGYAAPFNESGEPFSTWTFRKAPGFFDIVTYTGTGSKRTVNHSLGCKPGMIVIKRTDTGSNNWDVWHKSLGNDGTNNNYMVLNSTTRATGTSRFGIYGTDDPTSTTFTVKDQSEVNASGGSYVAYLFAGGESDAATARSVDFDGNGDYLNIATSSDFAFGTGNFTIEFWHRCDGFSNYPHQVDFRVDGSNTGTTNSLVIYMDNSGITHFWLNGSIRISANAAVPIGQWQHVALVRSGTTTTLYINGISQGTYSDSTDYGSSTSNSNPLVIGQRQGSYASNSWNGEISNFRIVKGTAVYTSSFRPPTEPLTNITNTKLLCCNNSSTTGSTVTPGTITANGNPTASTDSPFDDPAGFAFGDAGDQNVIKCGRYVGNGSTTGPEINLGWEPQWLLCKKSDFEGGGANVSNWHILDSMRGTASGGPGVADDQLLMPNLNNTEVTIELADFTSTGFKNTSDRDAWNYAGDGYVYVAIRRPDAYCGKPAEAGTDVFNIAYGDNDGAAPSFKPTNFAVDMGLIKAFASVQDWPICTRLTQGKQLFTNTTSVEGNNSNAKFDYQSGWNAYTSDNTSNISWMWKRHAGFDVVTWEGDDTNAARSHNLGRTPEMIWFKNRDATRSWRVYHKGLNGGTNPEDYAISINASTHEGSNTAYMNGTAPTSTHFIAGLDGDTNVAGDSYIALLFASVDGISKCGFYDGSGSSRTITTGFQPRFIIFKCTTNSESWFTFDTTRGWASGNDQFLQLNDTAAQSGHDVGAPTSTGFTIADGHGAFNQSGRKYIYYAHA